jgi:uncharacterized membrane protein YjfL (UPF0719 family)
MVLQSFLMSLAYLATAMVLFIGGRAVFAFSHGIRSLKTELSERDNLALALAMGGYFLGLTIAVGGAFSGPSHSFTGGLLGVLGYGALAVVLLSLSVWINDRVIFTRFSEQKEIINDQNCGVGLVRAANYIAMGFILYGTISGEGGGIVALLVFLVLGQCALIVAAHLYLRLVPYDVQQAMENGNAAVGASFAGMLFAIGNIVRYAVQGNFVSWPESLASFGLMLLYGLLVLPLVRFVTDRLLLPGTSLTHELVVQEKPNIGAGVVEGLIYACTSFLIGWSAA